MSHTNTKDSAKRIGIITFLYNNNYGSILQAYALQRVLSGMGHDVWHLNYRPDAKEKLRNFLSSGNSPKVLLDSFQKRRTKSYRQDLSQSKTHAFQIFSENHMRLTQRLPNRQALEKAAKSFDVLVCGSDQIWSPLWFNPIYFLDFATPDQTRVAYAASMGVSRVGSRRKAAAIQGLLTDFEDISLREAQGAEMLTKLLRRESIPVTLDPVCLLNPQEWLALAEMPEEETQTDYALCYFLGNNLRYWNDVAKFAKDTGLEIRVIPATARSYGQPYAQLDGLTPTQWLGYVAGARYVLTDSYHCMAFSILLRRPFRTFLRDQPHSPFCKNSRIEYLLESLGLALESGSANWERATEKMADMRTQSLDWLQAHV